MSVGTGSTGGAPGLEFIYTPVFVKSAERLLSEEDLRGIEVVLLRNPRAGDVIPAAGGLRKLRAPLPGRGKRGGSRIIYLFVEDAGVVYLLLAYAKSRQADLTSDEQAQLRVLASRLRRER